MTQKLFFVRMWVVLGMLSLLAACGGGGGGAPAPAAGVITISALLSSSQETSAVVSNASGVGTVTVDAATGKASGIIVTTGITGTAAHIHEGLPGVAGPIVIPFTGGPSIWRIPDDTFLTPAQMAALSSGQYYFNVHSAANPGGEIRGQITQQLRFASLSGANEPTPVTTAAFGVAVLALNPVTKQIDGFIKTSGIVGTLAHIHEGAAGVNGPVAVPLTETAPGSGIWAVPAGSTLTDAQIALFNAGELYYNVHSAANPGGEIRGQIVATTLTVRTSELNGTQVVPSVVTGANGSGITVVNAATREVYSDIRSTGVVGTLAHIHDGDVGGNGAVIVNLAQTAAGSGLWSIPDSLAERVRTAAQVARFNTGGLYHVVHSAANPVGEIRGQINLIPEANIFNLGGGIPVGAAPPTGTPAPIIFPSSGLSFSSHIQQVFDLYCTACHAPGRLAGFFPLTAGVSYPGLVGVPALDPLFPGIRVVAGNSGSSILYQRVSGVGLPAGAQRMPLGGPFLDTLNPSALNAIRAWIDEGALNN